MPCMQEEFVLCCICEIGAQQRVRNQEEGTMRRWVWSALLLVAVMAALTVGAAAEDNIVTEDGIKYNLTTGTVLGPVNKDSPVTVIIKGKVNGTKIASIGKDAFNGCGKLRTVEIESDISTIEMSAFNSCPVLETVFFPDTIKFIDSYAFANCVKLNKVVIPPLLETIKSGTFAGCKNLSSIYIGSIKDIEADAFSDTKVQHLHCDDDTGPTQMDTPPLPVHRTTQIPGVKEDPTCTKDGSQTYSYSCSVCKTTFNFSQIHPIPALGHDPGDLIPEVPSTCSKDGTTAGRLCKREGCNGIAEGLQRIPKDPMDPAKHNATLETIKGKDATCTETGLTDGTRCPDCGTMVTPQTETSKIGHKYETKTMTIREATCSEEGLKGTFQICSVCGTAKECEDCEKLKDDQEKYEQHIKDSHNGQPIDKKDHTPGESKYVVTTPATCEKEGEETWKVVCSVCKQECGDDPMGALDHPARKVPALGHDLAGGIETITKEPTCTEPGEKTVSAQKCKREGCDFEKPEQTGVKVDPLGHDLTAPVDKINAVPATCEEEGEDWLNFRECKRDGCDYEEKTVVKKRGAHTWENPKADPDPKDENGNSVKDKAPTCGEEGVSYVIITCSVCGETEHRAITLPATGQHDWGEWETKEPTLTQPGEKKRVCKVCEKEDVIVIPATGEPSDPDDPDKPTEPEQPKTYSITVVQGAGGTASVNPTTAQEGDRITVTLSPNSGYELDMIRAIGGGTDVLSLTDLGGGQHRFTMPASNVEIRVTFERTNSGSGWAAAPGDSSGGSDARRTSDVMPTQNATLGAPQAWATGQRFQDVPVGHWAAGEIEWANQMGYMNGTGGRFNPDGNITNQQMWMILARITGSNPANMAEARHWAVQGGYADGSSPTGPVKRHQLVTALYRCARLSGSMNRNTTSLAGYNDSRNVPAVARDAFSWALANGIISGSADKNLMPNGYITRAQFAVILYRYSQRV